MMDAFKRSTKQIASKYKDNLTYWYRPHYLRRAKLLLFLVAIFVSGVLVFGRYKTSFFSTGPLTQNHARYENRCEVCHIGTDPSLAGLFKSSAPPIIASPQNQPAAASLPDFGDGSAQPALQKAGLGKIGDVVQKSQGLHHLDQACYVCHKAYTLHMPQFQQLALKDFRTEISGAEILTCSNCHREHVGPDKMPTPPSNNCTDCHGDINKLHQTYVSFESKGTPPPKTGAVVEYGGQRRFVSHRDTPHQPVAFKTFSDHPAFGYEGMRDPANISFNHARHFAADVKKGTSGALNCADCHKAGPDGQFMQPINYEQHCASCHALKLSAEFPELRIPHREPARVFEEMQNQGLTLLFYDYAVRYRRINDQQGQVKFIQDQWAKLAERKLDNPQARLESVFLTGDPPRAGLRPGQQQAFNSCALCHKVDWKDKNSIPLIHPTNMAERWLTRGPFNHAPHRHMDCIDCHVGATASKTTAQIIMPPKQLCVDCHRPLQRTTDTNLVMNVDTTKPNKELTAWQRKEGGFRSDCQYCHPRFHAPADATIFASQAKRKIIPHGAGSQ